MKRGFTLVEMLIVVVVLVTLMTMTFRLSSLGGDSWRRNQTIARLQRLENCLSGYYAAFGTYPPVKLHGSRNPWVKVQNGVQGDEDDEDENVFNRSETEAWAQVEAACRAQPVACNFPFPRRDYSEFVKAQCEQLQEWAKENQDALKDDPYFKRLIDGGFDDGVSQNPGRHDLDKTEWRDVQLFSFGLMSYLLPRYLVMITNDNEPLYKSAQWRSNNTLPRNALDGKEFNGWDDICDKVNGNDKTELAKVSNIASQAVCARWMANLENSVRTPRGHLSVFGINIKDNSHNAFWPERMRTKIHYPRGYDGGGNPYILDECSVCDGWGNDYFYYSPDPCQSYVLWSSGPNGKTFPPWMDREKLDSTARDIVSRWTKDDIVSMSH